MAPKARMQTSNAPIHRFSVKKVVFPFICAALFAFASSAPAASACKLVMPAFTKDEAIPEKVKKDWNLGPRRELGRAIKPAETEAGGGKLALTRWPTPRRCPVTLQINRPWIHSPKQSQRTLD
jgi:hypothetical protein